MESSGILIALCYLPSRSELLIVGGGSAKDQAQALRRGVDIVVATPGRLEDLVEQGALSLENCRFFVLDECVSVRNV